MDSQLHTAVLVIMYHHVCIVLDQASSLLSPMVEPPTKGLCLCLYHADLVARFGLADLVPPVLHSVTVSRSNFSVCRASTQAA